MADVFTLRDEVCIVREMATLLGRLSWLRMLGSADYEVKAAAAALAAQCFDLAFDIDEFLRRTIQVKPRSVVWPSELIPRIEAVILPDGVDLNSLDIICTEIASCGADAADATRKMAASIGFVDNWDEIISRADQLIGQYNCADYPTTLCLGLKKPASDIVKTIAGPSSVPLNPVFVKSYSLRSHYTPRFSENIAEVIPYFWTLSIREAMACDSCGLSGVEYDGLPLSFYRDLSKQAWDEARHARMFLELSKSLMIETRGKESFEPRLGEVIANFLDGGEALPVPLEGNLYPAMFNASLEERLILMQIQTEGRAVAKLKKRIRSDVASTYPSIRRALEIDQRDEIFHTTLGRNWLAFLIPDKHARAEKIRQTELLRGFLISTALVKGDFSEAYSFIVNTSASSAAELSCAPYLRQELFQT